MPRIALCLSFLLLCATPAMAQLVTPESEGGLVTPATPEGQPPAGENAEPEYVAPPKSIPEGAEMTAWAAQAVCKALTLDYKSYSMDLKKASKKFSHPGWKQFTSDLLATRMIENMTAQQQHMSPEPCPEPTLTEVTDDGGQKKWHYKMPLMLQLVGDEIGLTSEMEAAFTVERTLSYSDGLNITSFDLVEKAR